MVTPLDRLARSTRDLLNTLAAIVERGARFGSIGDDWADTTTTAHGRLILTVLGGLAEFERELIRAPHRRRPRPRRGERRHDGAQAEAHPPPEARGDPPPSTGARSRLPRLAAATTCQAGRFRGFDPCSFSFHHLTGSFHHDHTALGALNRLDRMRHVVAKYIVQIRKVINCNEIKGTWYGLLGLLPIASYSEPMLFGVADIRRNRS
jgi:hypothetical protein